MDTKVSVQILGKTVKCNSDFACQHPGWHLCGKVKVLINDIMLLCSENEEKEKDCGYMTVFKDGFFCKCPTRVEIYKKYKI